MLYTYDNGVYMYMYVCHHTVSFRFECRLSMYVQNIAFVYYTNNTHLCDIIILYTWYPHAHTYIYIYMSYSIHIKWFSKFVRMRLSNGISKTKHYEFCATYILMRFPILMIYNLGSYFLHFHCIPNETDFFSTTEIRIIRETRNSISIHRR